MKIRNGFVSNSSSSSFVINLSDLNEWQISAIVLHIEIAKMMVKCKKRGLDHFEINYDKESISDIPADLGLFDEKDRWEIMLGVQEIYGYTTMNNFNMEGYLDYLGIDRNLIKWDN